MSIGIVLSSSIGWNRKSTDDRSRYKFADGLHETTYFLIKLSSIRKKTNKNIAKKTNWTAFYKFQTSTWWIIACKRYWSNLNISVFSCSSLEWRTVSISRYYWIRASLVKVRTYYLCCCYYHDVLYYVTDILLHK